MSFLTKREAKHRSESLSVQRVSVHLDLREAKDPFCNTYEAVSTFILLTSQDTVLIDCDCESVTSVLVDGNEHLFEIQQEHILLRDLKIDESIRIDVRAQMRFSRSGQGLHRFFDSDDGSVYCYTHFEPNDAHRAWPCFDQPDIKPLWTFKVSAPKDWIVRSNRSEITENDRSEIKEFGTTEHLPAYLTGIIAGNWSVYEAPAWTTKTPSGLELTIPISIIARKSMASNIDIDDIVDITRQGLDFFHKRYNYAYPWGKYDQIFVPEFNIGAMENPGLVIFNENYIFRDDSTRAQRQRRATTILHEMCHMWFGNLVTPLWWDDLWLKESFAEYEALCALSATRYTTGWASFSLDRKISAYEADSYTTSHPIIAKISTAEEAFLNFDAISYSKGAAVLKQLVAWIGKDIYISRIREYFQQYAFGVATSTDFLTLLINDESTSEEWIKSWFKTAGTTMLRVDDLGEELELTQRSANCLDEKEIIRPLTFQVAFWPTQYGNPQTKLESHVRFHSKSIRLDKLSQLYIVNDTDSAFINISLPDNAYQTLAHSVSSLTSPLTRALVWQTLYLGVRNFHYHPISFIHTVLEHSQNGDDTLLGHLCDHMLNSVTFLPIDKALATLDEIYNYAYEYAHTADKSDLRDIWARTAIKASAWSGSSERQVELRGLTSHTHIERKWDAVTALSAIGIFTCEDIQRWQKLSDNTVRGRLRGIEAIYAAPQSTEQLLDCLVHQKPSLHGVKLEDLSNAELRAMITGLTWLPLQRSLSMNALEHLITIWASLPQHLAVLVIKSILTLPFFDAGQFNEEVENWLKNHREAPFALRRVVIEALELQQRRLRSRLKWK